jgi:hypothetical protein
MLKTERSSFTSFWTLTKQRWTGIDIKKRKITKQMTSLFNQQHHDGGADAEKSRCMMMDDSK